MKRKIYNKLLEWKRESADKYALLVEGARRVGKSWIVKEFAKNEYKSFLIIDFAKTSRRIKELFDEKLDNLDEFFMLLEARTRTELIRGETLIVFDEVQRFPRAREAIKKRELGSDSHAKHNAGAHTNDRASALRRRELHQRRSWIGHRWCDDSRLIVQDAGVPRCARLEEAFPSGE